MLKSTSGLYALHWLENFCLMQYEFYFAFNLMRVKIYIVIRVNLNYAYSEDRKAHCIFASRKDA